MKKVQLLIIFLAALGVTGVLVFRTEVEDKQSSKYTQAVPPPAPHTESQAYDGPWPGPSQIKRQALLEKMERRRMAFYSNDASERTKKQNDPAPIPTSIKRHAPGGFEKREVECLERSSGEEEYVYIEGVLKKHKFIPSPSDCLNPNGCETDKLSSFVITLITQDDVLRTVYLIGTKGNKQKFRDMARQDQRYASCAENRTTLGDELYVMKSVNQFMLIKE